MMHSVFDLFERGADIALKNLPLSLKKEDKIVELSGSLVMESLLICLCFWSMNLDTVLPFNLKVVSAAV